MLSEASKHHSKVEKEIAETKRALEQRLQEMDANDMEKAEQLAVCSNYFFASNLYQKFDKKFLNLDHDSNKIDFVLLMVIM